MQIFSALDAVSPGLARTKLVLFTPFRKGRMWKFSATAYLATAGTAFLPFMLIYLALAPAARKAAGPWAGWAVIGAVISITALYVWIFYLCSRIRFAFFDIVLNRDQFVRPAWRKYGPQALRWTMFKIVLGTVVTALAVVPLAGYFHHMFAMFSAIRPGEKPSPAMIGNIFAGYAAFFLVYLVFGLFFFVCSLLSDFIVPSLALEDTTFGEAFRRFGRLIRNEPGQFTLYAVLKLVMGLAGYVGAMILFEIVLLLAMAVIAAVAVAIGLLLHLMHVPMAVLIALAILLGVACYVFFLGYCFLLVMGTILTFLEAYALYFLGGRYPLLGDLLEQSMPPPIAYMPPAGYPPYYPPPGYSPPGEAS